MKVTKETYYKLAYTKTMQNVVSTNYKYAGTYYGEDNLHTNYISIL